MNINDFDVSRLHLFSILLECITNKNCADNLTCSNEKCVEPCQPKCAENAYCRAKNHIAINCTCSPGYVGDPIEGCKGKL